MGRNGSATSSVWIVLCFRYHQGLRRFFLYCLFPYHKCWCIRCLTAPHSSMDMQRAPSLPLFAFTFLVLAVAALTFGALRRPKVVNTTQHNIFTFHYIYWVTFDCDVFCFALICDLNFCADNQSIFSPFQTSNCS